MQVTWDLIILLLGFLGLVYGMLIGKKKILAVLVNLYIAFAVVMVAGDKFHSFISNFQIISKNLASSAYGSKTILLVILAALLTIKSELSGLENTSISKLQGGVYGLLTVGFILSTTFSFMSTAELTSLNSNFALIINQYQIVWVVFPVVFMILSAFFRGEKKSKKKKKK